MLKKLPLVFGLMMALCAAPVLMAQMPATEAEAIAAFEKEKPLTQKDMDAYIKILSQAKEIGSDQDKLIKAYKDAGLTEIRGHFVTAKIGMAMMAAQMGEQAEAMLAQIPPVLKPSKDESDLVSKNMDKIQKAAEAMAQ